MTILPEHDNDNIFEVLVSGHVIVQVLANQEYFYCLSKRGEGESDNNQALDEVVNDSPKLRLLVTAKFFSKRKNNYIFF